MSTKLAALISVLQTELNINQAIIDTLILDYFFTPDVDEFIADKVYFVYSEDEFDQILFHEAQNKFNEGYEILEDYAYNHYFFIFLSQLVDSIHEDNAVRSIQRSIDYSNLNGCYLVGKTEDYYIYTPDE